MHRASSLSKTGRQQEAQVVRKQAQKVPSQVPDDPDYRRLRFCRYADDFLLGCVGPKEEAEDIKERLRTFLQEELKLERVFGQNVDYARQDRNSAVSQRRNPYDPGGLAARSTGSAKSQWKHWIACPRRSHQKQVSTLQTAQPKSAPSNRTHQ